MKRVAAIITKNFLSIMSFYEKNVNDNQNNKDLQLGIYIIIIFLLIKDII